MRACYPESISRVLKSEGGYVNHPSDPGGPTNFGITLAVYRQYGGKPKATAADVKAMTVEEAKAIYKAQYWNPVHGDDDPAGLDYTLFDYGVNSGPSRANKVLRRVCSLPDNADWPTTFNAIAKRDAKALISAVNAERLRFLQSLKTWPTFGKGWGARVQSVNAAALKMVGATSAGTMPIPSQMPALPEPTPGKGEVPKPKTAGKVVVASGGGGAPAAGFSFGEWISAHPIASAAIFIVTVIALIVIADLIAKRWQARKQDAPTPGLIPVPELKAA
jgi:lysozyme family protein